MTTKTRIRKTTWNTYQLTGYTHDVGNDQASAGGVHLHQVRLYRGRWQTRICQSNGRHQSYGHHYTVDTDEGERLFAQAQTY